MNGFHPIGIWLALQLWFRRIVFATLHLYSKHPLPLTPCSHKYIFNSEAKGIVNTIKIQKHYYY